MSFTGALLPRPGRRQRALPSDAMQRKTAACLFGDTTVMFQ